MYLNTSLKPWFFVKVNLNENTKIISSDTFKTSSHKSIACCHLSCASYRTNSEWGEFCTNKLASIASFWADSKFAKAFFSINTLWLIDLLAWKRGKGVGSRGDRTDGDSDAYFPLHSPTRGRGHFPLPPAPCLFLEWQISGTIKCIVPGNPAKVTI